MSQSVIPERILANSLPCFTLSSMSAAMQMVLYASWQRVTGKWFCYQRKCKFWPFCILAEQFINIGLETSDCFTSETIMILKKGVKIFPALFYYSITLHNIGMLSS
jgi:hypothetical protein